MFWFYFTFCDLNIYLVKDDNKYVIILLLNINIDGHHKRICFYVLLVLYRKI